MKIRAHHLLCMQGFQGYGYSPDFVANMQRVIDRLAAADDTQLEISDRCDVICSRCPHCKANECRKSSESHRKVRRLDRRVLAKLQVDAGSIFTAKEIFARVNTMLAEIGDVGDICGNCSWQEQCLWYGSLGKQ